MKTAKLDWRFVSLVSALVALGVIMIFSTSPTVGIANYDNSYFFIKRHLIFLCIGVMAAAVGYFFPHRYYRSLLIPGFFAACFLLALTLNPNFGVKIGGAQRWLNLGIQFQPVEIAKFFIVVYLAAYFEHKSQKIQHFTQGFLPTLIMLAIPILLLAKQPDLGNTLLIVSTFMALMFINRAAITQLLMLCLMGVVMVGLSIFSNPYQIRRIQTFLSPWDDPLGQSYHIIQSFIAIGSGGIFGLGLGESKLKYYYLPLHYSDFIFSILCEEGGLILGAIVILLFWALFNRGMKIAIKAKSSFSMALAMGLTFLLVFQALINIGCVIGLFPVTGIPLTFMSFGGTSLVISLFYVGVILNIAKS